MNNIKVRQEIDILYRAINALQEQNDILKRDLKEYKTKYTVLRRAIADHKTNQNLEFKHGDWFDDELWSVL